MAREQEEWLEILAKMTRGDREALAKITSVISGFLARYRAYDRRDSWDDLIQDVLISLIRTHERGSIRDSRAFVSYVGTTTRNKLIDFTDRDKKPGSADLLGDPAVAEASADPAWRGEEREVDVLLDMRAALEKLPDRERSVIEAVYMVGHKYEEAAKLLDLPLGTLKRIQNQGMKSLREIMGVS
jgi:RNA polymerase sigma-70 factor (ECF subfamily)